MDTTTIIFIVGFVSVIATQLFQYSASIRDRRWAREDDQRKQDIMAQSIKDDLRQAVIVAEQKAVQLAASLAAADKRAEDAVKKAEEDRVETAKSRADVARLIMENTRLTQVAIDASTKAIDIGNNFNKKLHEVGLTIAKRASNSMERIGDKPIAVDTVNVDAKTANVIETHK